MKPHEAAYLYNQAKTQDEKNKIFNDYFSKICLGCFEDIENKKSDSLSIRAEILNKGQSFWVAFIRGIDGGEMLQSGFLAQVLIEPELKEFYFLHYPSDCKYLPSIEKQKEI